MNTANFDDPDVEEQWCEQQRIRVVEYLKIEKIDHGEIGEWPAFLVAPFVSIWAIESLKAPGWLGWWVISGDLPTDYVSAINIKHPRDAMRSIAERWLEVASYMERGIEHPDINIGSPLNQLELSSLLNVRARLLLECANNDSEWGEEYD